MSAAQKTSPRQRIEHAVESCLDRALTQAFVAGQMDAQFAKADDLTKPALSLLKAKAYALAQSSLNELRDAAAAEALRLAKLELVNTSFTLQTTDIEDFLKAIDDLLSSLLGPQGEEKKEDHARSDQPQLRACESDQRGDDRGDS